MSWPSSYGYKYTPIGLRQRDIVEDSGKTVSTTVHLPEGGHLLDIERKYAPDGSIAKKETSTMPYANVNPIPHIPESQAPAPAAAPADDPFPALPSFGKFEPRGISDLEKKADDIIANFRARHQTGLDRWM